jgi:hypothetical protein
MLPARIALFQMIMEPPEALVEGKKTKESKGAEQKLRR